MKSQSFRKKLKSHFKWLNLSTEKKQKVFAAAIFIVFFIGLAYVCFKQFPDINRGTVQYQNQSNFAVHISPADLNKSTARTAKSRDLFSQSMQLTEKFKEHTNSFTKQLALLAPIIKLEDASSVYQSENYSRIIVDQNNNLVNLPQWTGVDYKVESVKALAKHADKNDASFFYVQLPTAVNNNTTLPYGIYDNSSVQTDRLLKKLKNTYAPQINIVDLRKKQKTFGKQITYGNDALLLPSTAQKAADFVATVTEKTLELEYLLDPNKTFSNKNNYKKRTIKNHFAGDFTLALGERIAPKANFPIIVPKFNTKYWVNTYAYDTMNNHHNNTFTGSLQDAVMDSSLFTSSEECNNGYLREGSYCVTINNLLTQAGNEFSALVISDQQGKAFATFFSQYVKNLTFVDADSHSFSGRIKELIKENQYDAVYVLVSDTTYALEDFWNFDERETNEKDITNKPQSTHSVS